MGVHIVGLGTIINVAAILAAGLIGMTVGRFLNERLENIAVQACGVSTLFIGISGTLRRMLVVTPEGIVTQGELMLIISMVLGSLIGEILNIQQRLEDFGTFLRDKSGNKGEGGFVDAFLTASLTVCIGAMAIIGAIQDGIYGDYSILAAKSVLDFVIVIVMTASLGKGAIFSAVPVGIVQGTFTLLARLIEPVLTQDALSNSALVGNVMIFCVGLNLLWKNKIRVANMLPGLVIAVIFSFF